MTIILITVILLGFLAMSVWKMTPDVVMPVVALLGLLMAGSQDAELALTHGFEEFSRIALFFTAVAVPAHQLKSANCLRYAGLWLGEKIGYAMTGNWRLPSWLLVPAACLSGTYVMASLFHNTTSILIMAPIVTTICEAYKIRPLPVLHGLLVASNLGGFSTKWGDTPNIIESYTWNLSSFDFFQILPVNVGCLILLIFTVGLLVRGVDKTSRTQIAIERRKFCGTRRNLAVDRRGMMIGSVGLVIGVGLPLFLHQFGLTLAALALAFCVIFERTAQKSAVLTTLGIETYLTFAAVFVLARILGESSIGVGPVIAAWLKQSSASVWAVATLSFMGTLFTEAASWASTAAPIVYSISVSHQSAFALGGGICAGSSSLATAASAGIILLMQTKDNSDDSKVTFASYLKFGLPFSLLMLGYYIFVLWLI